MLTSNAKDKSLGSEGKSEAFEPRDLEIYAFCIYLVPRMQPSDIKPQKQASIFINLDKDLFVYQSEH